MPKLSHAFMFAFLLAITFNLSQANSEANTKDLITATMDNMSEIRSVMLCLTRSCDPLAVQKAFAVDDSSEMNLKQKPYDSESDIDRVLKLSAVVSAALSKFLAIEPECKDHLYTCPARNGSKPAVPSELFEFADLVEMMVLASKCTTNENIPQAIRVLGDAVAYIESNTDAVGTSTSRFLPAVELAAKGFKEMCNPPKKTVSTDEKSLAMDLRSSLLKDKRLAKIINKVLLLVPTKDKSKKPFWIFVEKDQM